MLTKQTRFWIFVFFWNAYVYFLYANPTTTNKPTQLTYESTSNVQTTNIPTTIVSTDHTTSTDNPNIYPYQKVSIEINCVPEYGAGVSSWGMITGVCNCVNVISNISEITCDQSNIFIDWSTSYSVVIYSVTNAYYIQPWGNDYYTTISDLGVWSRRIHLGYEYEVDLVEFEDSWTVINTDSKDASEHDPECISTGSTASNNINPTTTVSKTDHTTSATDHTTSTTDNANIYPYQKVSIEINCVPEHGAGASSWGMITGICNCVNVISNISEIACDQSNIFIDWSTSYSVVIYSVTNKHYIQPYDNDYYTTISDLGLWSRRIHLGYEYEVDLVEFEDRWTVINTDSKDASIHDPECISTGSTASLFSVFLTLMVLLMSYF